MKCKRVKFVIIIYEFVGSDVQQLPFPHGSHHTLGDPCDFFCRSPEVNCYIKCWRERGEVNRRMAIKI